MLAKDMEKRIAPLAKALKSVGVRAANYDGRRDQIRYHSDNSNISSCCSLRETLLRVSVATERAQAEIEDVPLILAQRGLFTGKSPIMAIIDCVYHAFLSGDQPEFLEWCRQIHQEDIEDKF